MRSGHSFLIRDIPASKNVSSFCRRETPGRPSRNYYRRERYAPAQFSSGAEYSGGVTVIDIFFLFFSNSMCFRERRNAPSFVGTKRYGTADRSYYRCERLSARNFRNVCEIEQFCSLVRDAPGSKSAPFCWRKARSAKIILIVASVRLRAIFGKSVSLLDCDCC